MRVRRSPCRARQPDHPHISQSLPRLRPELMLNQVPREFRHQLLKLAVAVLAAFFRLRLRGVVAMLRHGFPGLPELQADLPERRPGLACRARAMSLTAGRYRSSS